MEKVKNSFVLLFSLLLSLTLSGCSNMSSLLRDALVDATTGTESADNLLQTDGEVNVMAGGGQELITYADKVAKDTGLDTNWNSLEFAFQNKKCNWIGKKLSEVQADSGLNLFNLSETSELPPGTQLDVGLSTEEYANSGGMYKRFIFSLTVANPNPKQTIPIEDAKVIAITLNNMMTFPGEISTDGTAWVLPQGVMLGGSPNRVRELYGEPDYTWGDEGKPCFAYVRDGKGLTIWAAKYPPDAQLMIETVLLRDLSEPDFITKGRDHTEFAPDLSGNPYLNVAGYKIYMNTPLSDAIENLNLIPLDSEKPPQTIAAGTAADYVCRMAGYGNNVSAFRVQNTTDAEIPIENGTIVGFQIKQYKTVLDPIESRIFQLPVPEYSKPGDSPKGLPYTASVYGPYGITSGDSQKDFLAKAPADAKVTNPYDSGDQRAMEANTADYCYQVTTDGGYYQDLPDDEYYVTEFMIKTTNW